MEAGYRVAPDAAASGLDCVKGVTAESRRVRISATVSLAELVYPSGRVHHLLLTSKKRMAGGAYFDMQVPAGRAGGEFVPATAGHFDLFVIRVYIRFHGGLVKTVFSRPTGRSGPGMLVENRTWFNSTETPIQRTPQVRPPPVDNSVEESDQGSARAGRTPASAAGLFGFGGKNQSKTDTRNRREG